MSYDHTTVARPLLSSPGEYAIAVLLAVVAGATIWTWATGQIAALLFSGAWIDVNLTDAITTTLHLPAHGTNPRGAWPPEAQTALPGPVGMYGIATVTAAGLGYGARLVVRRVIGARSRRGFASRRQLDAALTARAAKHRAGRLRPLLDGKPSDRDVSVDLGTSPATGQKLALPIDSSVLLVAASRVGKTSQVIIPWVAEWPGPAVVTSLRRDVVDYTYTLRQAQSRGGPVAVLDLTDTAWPNRVQWSPLHGCASFDTAHERADVMVAIGKSDGDDSRNAGFFGLTSTNLLASWLHAAAISHRSMEDVVKWSLDEHDAEPVGLLQQYHGAPGVAELLDRIYASHPETRNNMFTTVQTATAPLLSTAGKRTFCPAAGAGFDIEEFLRGSGTVYIVVSERQAGRLAPLISTFVDEIVASATRIGDDHLTGRIDPPLGMILDEVNNVAPLPILDKLLSYSAGSGVFVAAVLQHMAAAKQRWGQVGAEALWGSATTKIALGGLNNDDAERFSREAGMHRERLSTPQYSHHGTHTSVTLNDRRTMEAGDVRTLAEADREALIIHSTTPPAKTRLQRHYEHPRAAEFDASARHLRGLINPGPNQTTVTRTLPWEEGEHQ